MRLQIAIFGRTNVGKSTFLNFIAGQDVAITSPVPGTTTDVVEKSMELLPLGPVVLLDTAGLDDSSELGGLRIEKSAKVFNRADIIVIICEAEHFGDAEKFILDEADKRKIPVIAVINKIDLHAPSAEFIHKISGHGIKHTLCIDSINGKHDECLAAFKQALIECCPEEFINSPPVISDLVSAGGIAVLVVPIDLQAPRGRLILPQVQTIRDTLDSDAIAIVVKEREYRAIYDIINKKPDIVVCDSQCVLKMIADTPPNIPCTTFSILFSRLKGNIIEMAKGAAVIEKLKSGDRVAITEACSHHALEDDIGRVKIPRWLRQYAGASLNIDVFSGRDFPANLNEYQLVIHCGGCMLNRREILSRIEAAKKCGTAITNYGMAIATVQGVITQVLRPFPAALNAFQTEQTK